MSDLPEHRPRSKRHSTPIPAVVFGCLKQGELRINIYTGLGLASGGIPLDVPTPAIPPDLRMPNTLIWLKLDEDENIVQIWRREK